MPHDYVKQSELIAVKCGNGTSRHNITLCSTYFGLTDLGFSCPELGSVSLSEIASLILPLGLSIERDLHFEARFALTVYADAARLVGRITEDEARLEAAALAQAHE
ncbi:MAG: hypothetical protein ACJAVZ_004632 [Afipia broomeae]|jgi:hypothetical protein